MAMGLAVATTATEALTALWQEKFFRAWRKKSDVVSELAEREYHFSDADLGMALLRARHLTRRGRRGAYEYIQKYPFMAEKANGTRGVQE